MSSDSSRNGRLLVWGIVIALFVLHQDFWWWDNKTLVFGFMPIGLFYHAAFSVVAGLTWALAIKVAWPAEIEAWAAEGEEGPARSGGDK